MHPYVNWESHIWQGVTAIRKLGVPHMARGDNQFFNRQAGWQAGSHKDASIHKPGLTEMVRGDNQFLNRQAGRQTDRHTDTSTH